MALAAAVFAGSPTAPLLALLLILAPLLALVARQRSLDADGPRIFTMVAGLITVGAAQAASVMILTGVAALLGVPPWQLFTALGVWALSIVAGRRVSSVWSCAFVLGLAGLVGVLVAMGLAVPAAPWTAWAQLATRPALTFSPGAAWVTEGRTVERPTTFTFSDTHQVTALTGGVVRIEIQEKRERIVRERRLNPGDVVAFRAGDRLTIPPDVRVRLEAGKRIPDAPTSGVAWAEPPRRPSWVAVVEALGLAVTLGGGAVTVLGEGARASRLIGAVSAPLLLITFVLCASSWGVYAVWFAGELGPGASTLGLLVEAVPLSLGAREPAALVLTGAGGLAMLFLGSAAGLANRVGVLTAPWTGSEARLPARLLPDVLWLGMLAVGVMLSQHGLESRTILWLGLGLGASAWAAPRLAGPRGGIAAGTVMGVLIFAGLSIAHALKLPWTAELGPYPALLAAPVALLVAFVGRRRRPSPRPLRVRPAMASVAGSERP